METFEDNGEFIEVLRVDRLFEDSYKIHFRRREFKLQKTSEQFVEFKKNLDKFYEGVSHVPELDFKDAHKKEIKYRV